MKKRILTLGNARIDLCLPVNEEKRAPRAPLIAESYSFVPTGSGANAAVAISRLGGDSVFCARVGRDRNGNDLKMIYEFEGVDTRFVTTDPSLPTGFCVLRANDPASKHIIVSPDANSALAASDITDAFICRPDALLMSAELDHELVIAAANLADERGVPIYLDACRSVASFPFDELPCLELFTPDETEVRMLTDISPDTPEKCLKAVVTLSKIVRARFYAIKLGSRGCYIYDGKYYHCLPSYDVKVKDTSAAGDAFTAAMTLEHISHRNIERAGKVACVVASLTVSRRGALVSLPKREDVAAFIADRTIRL